jgi:hypothetical protein
MATLMGCGRRSQVSAGRPCARHHRLVPTQGSRPFSLTAARQGGHTNKCGKELWRCSAPFDLACIAPPRRDCAHGEVVQLPCRRLTCPGCAARRRFELTTRLIAGIENVPSGFLPMFFTLTFPASQAPTETENQAAWRKLVGRLRYRRRMQAYAWVLQRTKRGVLHTHGVAHVRPWHDHLAEWRRLIVASGFGTQNRLEVARVEHARYIARYIARSHTDLAHGHRVYGFSRDFPQTPYVSRKQEIAELGAAIGLEPECEWVPAWEVRR